MADHIAYDEPEAYALLRELVAHAGQPGVPPPPRAIPLLFLQNTSGYMVGRDSEASSSPP